MRGYLAGAARSRRSRPLDSSYVTDGPVSQQKAVAFIRRLENPNAEDVCVWTKRII